MRYGVIRIVCVALALGLLPAASAAGGLDVDFGASVRVGDDTDVFFAISSRYFDRDRGSVEAWGRHYDNPDDLAVALFVSRSSGKSPDFIFSLRHQGLSWWDIGLRVGLPVDVWFVPVTHDPGPPYGKAYGHWKKHRGPRPAFVLTDADLRNLVAVRMVHEYYGVPVEVAMEWRASGRDVRALVAGEYGRRHGKGASAGSHGKKSGKHGQGRGKGHR